jgi:S-adenosylmethionine-diacylglycerol 3-amino-3-carboxypropyl transferase
MAQTARFDLIRYAQVWEDAAVLLAGLDPQPGAVCLSIASAGDNALALLTTNPAKVIAFDVSVVQLHCLALRVAAYTVLEHQEVLELIGSRASNRRLELYGRCRRVLKPETKAFWDAKKSEIERGIGAIGKFEGYFSLFRRFILPLLLSPAQRRWLFCLDDPEERQEFFTQHIETWRWQGLLRLFFSPTVMGRLGRDPQFFAHTSLNMTTHLQQRVHHALVTLNPRENPYLDWIFWGTHRHALPIALQPQHFDSIRQNLDRLELRLGRLEEVLPRVEAASAYNLSDIFEYMPQTVYEQQLELLLQHAQPGARLAYWNLLAPRRRPEHLAERLQPLPQAKALFAADTAFFYSDFVLELVT